MMSERDYSSPFPYSRYCKHVQSLDPLRIAQLQGSAAQDFGRGNCGDVAVR